MNEIEGRLHKAEIDIIILQAKQGHGLMRCVGVPCIVCFRQNENLFREQLESGLVDSYAGFIARGGNW